MGRKKNQRQTAVKYEFDRLGHQKMEQVYDILFSKVMADYEKELVLSPLKDSKQLVHGSKKR